MAEGNKPTEEEKKSTIPLEELTMLDGYEELYQCA